MEAIEARKIEAEIQKIFDEAAKTRAEEEKIRTETRWYPMASAGIGAIAGGLIVALSNALIQLTK